MKLLYLLLITGLFNSLGAQNRFSIFLSDISETGNGITNVVSTPLHWEWEDAALLAGTAAVFTILYSNDQYIFNSLEKNRGRTLESLSDIGIGYGEPLTVILLTGTVYGYGLIFNNNWARETAQILTTTLVPAGAIQTVSKISAGRARPYLNLGSKEFEPFRREEDYYSFVSGHTLVAVATSLVFARRINNYFAKSIFYGMAALGSWSRLYSRNHYASDVFLGGMLAFAASSAAFSWFEKKSRKESKYCFNLLPRFNGFDLQINF